MQNFCDIKQVVELLNMQPSKTSHNELRFGKRGSLSVDLKSNVWFDHEHMVGGGMLALVEMSCTREATSAHVRTRRAVRPGGLAALLDRDCAHGVVHMQVLEVDVSDTSTVRIAWERTEDAVRRTIMSEWIKMADARVRQKENKDKKTKETTRTPANRSNYPARASGQTHITFHSIPSFLFTRHIRHVVPFGPSSYDLYIYLESMYPEPSVFQCRLPERNSRRHARGVSSKGVSSKSVSARGVPSQKRRRADGGRGGRA